MSQRRKGSSTNEQMIERARKRLRKRAKRGLRGYPVATVALYGPNDTRATKLAVGIVPAEDAEATDLRRWFSEGADIRNDASPLRRFPAAELARGPGLAPARNQNPLQPTNRLHANDRNRRDPADGNPSRNGSVGWTAGVPDLPGP
jgi:hypothetical protein